MSDSAAYCYLLYTEDGKQTYVGATVDPDRRLRQHNKELVGGARATGIQVQRGKSWVRACYVPLPEWRTALQFEWRWKQLGRTRWSHIRSPLERRLRSLHTLLSMEKPTEKAIPYDLYPEGLPCIHWDSVELEQQYDTL